MIRKHQPSVPSLLLKFAEKVQVDFDYVSMISNDFAFMC